MKKNVGVVGQGSGETTQASHLLLTPRRMLVIMLRRIGDVILTTPAVHALKKLYPQAQIDFLTEPPSHEILGNNPDISRILLYDRSKGGLFPEPFAHWHWIRRVRQEHYDWVIDYMGNPRSAILTAFSGAKVRAGPGHVFHRWAYTHPLEQSQTACYAPLEKIRVLRSLGLKTDETDYLPKLTVSEDSRRRAETAVRKTGGSNGDHWIGFVPASRKITRQWPASSYAELGRLLSRTPRTRILVLWGPGEESLASQVARGIGGNAVAAPETKTLQDLAALISLCRLIITNCNGPKHIAVALGVPTLTIHGSSDPVSWNPPHHPQHAVIRREELFCIGCRLNACPYNLECLRELSPQQVAQRAQDMLGNHLPSPSGRGGGIL